jgi:hypothetical protein
MARSTLRDRGVARSAPARCRLLAGDLAGRDSPEHRGRDRRRDDRGWLALVLRWPTPREVVVAGSGCCSDRQSSHGGPSTSPTTTRCRSRTSPTRLTSLSTSLRAYRGSWCTSAPPGWTSSAITWLRHRPMPIIADCRFWPSMGISKMVRRLQDDPSFADRAKSIADEVAAMPPPSSHVSTIKQLSP